MPPVIVVEPIDVRNWRRALEVLVRPDQLHFVADHQPVALVILAKAHLRPAGRDWRPYLALRDEKVVGIVALAWAESNVDLAHFAVDHRSQGQGIGRAFLGAVLDLILGERPDGTEVRLTVQPDNLVAQSLYGSVGFAPTGATLDGEPIWHRSLGPKPTKA